MDTSPLPSGSLILVTGAGGFVGKAVVPALQQAGYRVRAMTRSMTTIDNAERVIGDITDVGAVQQAVHGVDAVIHLAARKSDESDSELVNVSGTKILAEACTRADVKRMINVSTQSVKLKKLGIYGKTKLASEKIMQNSGLPVITLRPSVVYDDTGGGIVSTILQFCQLPIIPMIGSGNVHFQPIHSDDLAAIIVRSLTHGHIGETYDIGGQDRTSLRGFTEEIQKRLGTNKPIFRIPLSAAMIIAQLTKWLPHPPVTVSNVLGGSDDVPMDITPMLRDFGVMPRRFSSGLDAVFASRRTTQESQEANAVLRYVFTAFGHWQPDDADIDLYQKALKTHSIPSHTLDSSVIRHPWILGALDATAPHTSILRRKLLIATAIGECSTQTAEWTLPRDESVLRIFVACVVMTIRVITKRCIGTMFLFLRPSFTRRNVG